MNNEIKLPECRKCHNTGFVDYPLEGGRVVQSVPCGCEATRAALAGFPPFDGFHEHVQEVAAQLYAEREKDGSNATALRQGGELLDELLHRCEHAFAEIERLKATSQSEDRYREALERIANFGHADLCFSSAPVYECGCYDKSQAEIAREALDAE